MAEESDSAFVIRVHEPAGGPVIVFVSGELDMSTAPSFEAALRACGERRDVEIDLTKVGFFDASALKVMVAVAERLCVSGCQVSLRGLSDHQRKVIRVTGLDDLFNPL